MTSKIEQIKEQLNQRKAELLKRLSRCQEDLQRRTEPVEKDFAEQATQRENDEVLEALAQASKEELNQINQALARMEEGFYTICSSCEEDIPEERLAAVPYTTLCVNCAEHA